jgi:hypothetical protein
MIDALSLDRVLRRARLSSLDRLAARFLDLHYARTDGMWLATRSHDVRFPVARSPVPPRT